MKTAIKLLIGLFFLPFLALAGLIAIVRLVFSLTIMLAWQKSDEWLLQMLEWINDKMQGLKKQ